MVQKSLFLIALISISSQSFLISGNHGDNHFMHSQMGYKEIVQLLDDLQMQPAGAFAAQENNEVLRLIKVSIEKDISSYYRDEKKVLTRKLLRLKEQARHYRIDRPRVVFSVATPLIVALSYYWWKDELSTKGKVIMATIGGMSLLALADYADFIGYTNKRLAAAKVVEVDIEDTINELLTLLS